MRTWPLRLEYSTSKDYRSQMLSVMEVFEFQIGFAMASEITSQMFLKQLALHG